MKSITSVGQGVIAFLAIGSLIIFSSNANAWRFDPGGIIEGTQKEVEDVVKTVDKQQKKIIKKAQNQIEGILEEANKSQKKLLDKGQKQAAKLHSAVIKKSMNVFAKSPDQLAKAVKLAPVYVYAIQQNGFKPLKGLASQENKSESGNSSLIEDFIEFFGKLLSVSGDESNNKSEADNGRPDSCFAWVATGVTPSGHHRSGSGFYCRQSGEKGVDAINNAKEEAKQHLGCDSPGGRLISFEIVHPGGKSTSYPVS